MAWTAKDRRRRVEAIMRRDGTRCWLCGEYVPPRDRTIDHAIPKARGGTNHVHNLRLAHEVCNQIRGMIVRTPPKAQQTRLAKLRFPLPVLELTNEMRVVAAEPLRLKTAA